MRSLPFLIGLISVVELFAPSKRAIAQPKPLQIGMARSFVQEQPKGFIEVATDDFKAVMKKTTGLNGDLVSKFSAAEVAEKLKAKQLDLGILHAHEFAWLKDKNPELKPLLIAPGKHHIERAVVVVHKSNPAKSLADLRGKKLDLPLGTADHCRVFLARETKGLAGFFSAIVKSETQKDALDEVARENVQATVVDLNGLDRYKDLRGPVFAKNMRILQQSEDFPPAVIVYTEGTLDKKTLEQFRDGLFKAHEIADGRDMMRSWNIERFEPIPKDYDKRLADLLKAYPRP